MSEHKGVIESASTRDSVVTIRLKLPGGVVPHADLITMVGKGCVLQVLDENPEDRLGKVLGADQKWTTLGELEKAEATRQDIEESPAFPVDIIDAGLNPVGFPMDAFDKMYADALKWCDEWTNKEVEAPPKPESWRDRKPLL